MDLIHLLPSLQLKEIVNILLKMQQLEWRYLAVSMHQLISSVEVDVKQVIFIVEFGALCWQFSKTPFSVHMSNALPKLWATSLTLFCVSSIDFLCDEACVLVVVVSVAFGDTFVVFELLTIEDILGELLPTSYRYILLPCGTLLLLTCIISLG
ncbi:hypothetical protein Sjap_004989 [Stephania japonica]|uniref:Uncharacterized protein n=1 Tax=Stephania japonica TaxID=461633 RepID=A0AAP0K3G0_9MAGN